MKKDRSERKKRIMIIAMGAIIILSMIASIFVVYVDQYSTSTITYGKQEFQVQQNSYTTLINKTKMSFSYYPSENGVVQV